MSQRIIHLLQDDHAPKLSVLVGSDNNIIALASVLGLHFKMPGYANDDPPIGGALGIELWRDHADGKQYVRVFYQAQSLVQLRVLQPSGQQSLPAAITLHLTDCSDDHKGLCPLETIISPLRKIAALAR
ncbi:hypothetical protein ISN73_13140 [Dyella acidisoli]|nr:histidine-type phosphatase [Dyella acidisoli]